MYCLVNIETLANEDRTAQNVFKIVKNLYEDSTDIRDSYLYEPDNASNINCIFGFEQPDIILKNAQSWNNRIFEELNRCVQHKYTADDLESDTYRPMLYDLKKAAMTADNDFYAFADYAAAIDPEQAVFQTTISKTERMYVLAHPEAYALIEVYPK